MSADYADLWKHGRAMVLLKIILDLDRPVLRRELISLTQGDDQAISRLCAYLVDQGLLSRMGKYAGWVVTDQGRSLFATEKPSTATSRLVKKPPITAAAKPQKPSARTQKRADTTRKPLRGTENTIHAPDSYLPNNPQQNISKEERINKPGFNQNLAFFQKVGIERNHLSDRLAAKFPPQVIQAQWQALVDKGKPWPGLLIKILSKLPEPVSEADQRRRYQTQLERPVRDDHEQRRRYQTQLERLGRS